MNSSSTCFIIDGNSIQGLEDEIRQLNIREEIEALSNDRLDSATYKDKIIIAMIAMIQTQFFEGNQIIIYFRIDSFSSQFIKTEVGQNFKSKNVKVLIGLQSLFYRKTLCLTPQMTKIFPNLGGD